MTSVQSAIDIYKTYDKGFTNRVVGDRVLGSVLHYPNEGMLVRVIDLDGTVIDYTNSTQAKITMIKNLLHLKCVASRNSVYASALSVNELEEPILIFRKTNE